MGTEREFWSFDGTEHHRGTSERPRDRDELFRIARAAPALIAQGSRLSYCAASAGAGVTSIDLSAFDRILELDAVQGEVVVEPGLRLGNLLEKLVPAGWWLPPLPGHPTITLGGCLGCNVHGKSQFHDGDFSDYVVDLTLFHPDHGEIVCSREREAELFWLTVGGFGLTGIVTRLRLRLLPLPTTSVSIERVSCRDVFDAVERMRSSAANADLLYSWNDFAATGRRFGRGFVYVERRTDEAADPPPSGFRSIGPEWRRSALLDALPTIALRAIPVAYRLRETLRPRRRTVHILEAAFPVSGNEIYFRLFGTRGLREYQILIPFDAWEATLRELASLCASAATPVTLGSLKLFRGEERLLHFRGEGVCLTIDCPATPSSRRFFERLDELAIRSGSIANLSKDSRLGAATAQRMYRGYARFRDGLLRWDPAARFQSSLRTRLGLDA